MNEDENMGSRSEPIYTTVDPETYNWIEKLKSARKDKSVAGTVRYIIESVKDIANGKMDINRFIEDIRRWTA